MRWIKGLAGIVPTVLKNRIVVSMILAAAIVAVIAGSGFRHGIPCRVSADFYQKSNSSHIERGSMTQAGCAVPMLRERSVNNSYKGEFIRLIERAELLKRGETRG